MTLTMREHHLKRLSGRPSAYSTRGAFAVAELVALGHSLRSIVRDLPRSRAQIGRWIAQHREFGALLAAARLHLASDDVGWALEKHRTGIETLAPDKLALAERWEGPLFEMEQEISPLLFRRTAADQEATLAWCAEQSDEDIATMDAVAALFLGFPGHEPLDDEERALASAMTARFSLRSEAKP
jgi:hypothetical protein